MNYQNRTSLSHAAIVYQNLSQVWRFDTPVVLIATFPMVQLSHTAPHSQRTLYSSSSYSNQISLVPLRAA